MVHNDTALEVRIAQGAWMRLSNAPVPRTIDDQGGRLFGVNAAVVYAVILYLCQGLPLPSTAPGTRSAVASLRLSLPPDLHLVLEERAAAEGRSKSSIIRAAVSLAFPPALLPLPGEDSAAPPALTTRRSLAAALAMAPSGDLAEIFA